MPRAQPRKRGVHFISCARWLAGRAASDRGKLTGTCHYVSRASRHGGETFVRRDGRMRKRREEHVGGGLDASVSRFPGKPGGAAVKSAPPPLSLSYCVRTATQVCPCASKMAGRLCERRRTSARLVFVRGVMAVEAAQGDGITGSAEMR